MVTEVTSKREGIMEVFSDGRLLLHLHEGQQRAHNSKARIVFMIAGTQSGKTSYGPHWLLQEIKREMARLEYPERGVGDFLAASATYDLFSMKMLPEMQKLFCDFDPFGMNIGRYWSNARTIELSEGLIPGKFWARRDTDPMWGRIILRSADAPAGLESATAKAVWLDEPGLPQYNIDTWEAISRRLSLSEGRVLGTSTIYNLGWMKTEIYDKWRKQDPDEPNPEIEVVQFPSTMNPEFPKASMDRARLSMPSWKFNMFYLGQFDKPAGLVYDSFDTAACIVPAFPIPENWLWHVGSDFGGSNPAHLMYAQDPGTGLFWLVDEYKPGAKSVGEQVEELKSRMRNRQVVRRLGGSHEEIGWRDDFRSHGWPIAEPGVHKVDVGIGRVYALHKLNQIMVFDTCHGYISEKGSYTYKLDERYDPTDEIEQKSSYHYMDAERYVLSGIVRDGSLAGDGPNQTHSSNFSGRTRKRSR